MKRLSRYFLNGLIFVAPVSITLYIIVVVFMAIDGLLQLPIPGLGFAITICLITLMGFLASNIITRSALNVVERILEKIPFAKLIYTSIKDMVNAFVGNKKSFDKPVLVKIFNNSDARIIGFITRESMVNFGLDEYVGVYFPQSYNFAGQLLLVPRDSVQPLKVPSSDILALVVSGGVSSCCEEIPPAFKHPEKSTTENLSS